MNEAENKVKEYIDRAINIQSQFSHNPADDIAVCLIAQMLQREEHFNKSKE